MTEPTPSTDNDAPIPQRQFMWYINFWHVVYLGTIAAMLFGVWWQQDDWINRRVALLAGLVAVQVLLYYKLIMTNPKWERQWPLPARDLWLYFGSSILIWWIEWQIEPAFFWLIMSYFGQMFGILPPIAAIPGTTAIYFLTQADEFDFANFNPGALIGVAAGWLSFIVIYLFIWYLVRTSSERGRLVSQLQTAQTQLALTHEKDVELAALRERERLARDLHDSLGHALVAMSVQLEAIQRLYKVDAARGSAHVDELKTLVRRSMDELRRSLDGLRAPGLGDRPLSSALQTLSVELGERTGLEVSCQVAPVADTLSPAISEVIWRVVQESITNIEKHAQSQRVQIKLAVEPNVATISVSDNGVGLPADAETRPGHYGLRGLRERVEGLGGMLSYASHGLAGTEVRASLPIINQQS